MTRRKLVVVAIIRDLTPTYKYLYIDIEIARQRFRALVAWRRDLGFRREEAEHLLVRADLMIQAQKLIASRRLKQREAARLLRVTQPRISDLLRGRIDLFSTDTLIDMLARLGARVRISVKSTRRTRQVA